MNAVHITSNDFEQKKAIKIIKALCLFVVMVFTSFPVSASDAYSSEKKQSLDVWGTQSHYLGVSASQRIYSFSSNSERVV